MCKRAKCSGVWPAELVCHGGGRAWCDRSGGGLFADGLVMCEHDGRGERDTEMARADREARRACLVIVIITDWHGRTGRSGRTDTLS